MPSLGPPRGERGFAVPMSTLTVPNGTLICFRILTELLAAFSPEKIAVYGMPHIRPDLIRI